MTGEVYHVFAAVCHQVPKKSFVLNFPMSMILWESTVSMLRLELSCSITQQCRGRCSGVSSGAAGEHGAGKGSLAASESRGLTAITYS